MKKQIMGFVLCFLLMGSIALAADGDLIVNGKVGIGTATPSQALEVNGLLKMLSNNQILLRDDTAGIYSSDTNEISFFTNSGNRMTINSSGNIGIGTNSPKGPLDITGTIPRAYIVKSDASANRGIWRLNGDTDGVLSLQSINDAQNSAYNAFTITRDSTNGIASVVFPNGFVGIGNTNPTYYLLTMEASGGGYYNQSNHSWVSPSSRRWKSSIMPITGALDTVLKLNGVSFKWKKRTDIYQTNIDGVKEYISSSWADDPYGRDDIGLIGEDVMKILPAVVDIDQNGSNFVTGVSYSKMVPLLIEAIKDQQTQIERLKSEIANLKK
jgi:hypothetical protein